jgi:hypothetical protein
MTLICAKRLAWAVSRAMLLLIACSGSVWAQGAPSIIWTAADGAGPIAFSADGQTLATAGGTSIRLRRA